jgi:acyl-CoA hydrolase/RimJ/RimL family protein N-acetyltransferase
MTPPRPSYDPDWKDKYADLLMGADQAVRHIRPGQRVFIGTGCAQPQVLVRALVGRSADLGDVEIVHLLTQGDAPYAQKDLADRFRVNSFFIAENVRDMIQEGLGDYTPIFLSDIPRLFRSGQLPLDVALIQVTPPDDKGFVSLGISVDIVLAAAQNAVRVIAQVNPRMPRTLGETSLHVGDLDALVASEEPLLEAHPAEADDATRAIGENVASLVADGSTLEVGIGRIPHAVLQHLRHRKDLGIHTEMLSDDVVDLVEAGVITGARKSLDRGKIVASFCLGTEKLYRHVDNNPMYAFRPTEYVNDPAVIAQQHQMVAVNTALEVDLTGQVCADSLGSRFFSGIGGQVDFNRGAARSRGGKAVIALPSTALSGKVSRIVGRLSPGAGVVTTRGDVHYVVTEYGVAYLHGKSVSERAMALIAIAHPDYRSTLLKEALEYRFLRPDLEGAAGRIRVSPPAYRSALVLHDGTQVHFRPIHPTDEPRIKDLFYALSQETVYYRFMSRMQVLPEKQAQDFTYVDHRSEVALVGTLPEAEGEVIIAVGRYYLDPKTNRAEVAFTVRDQWQNKGIGTFLLKQLVQTAKRNGIQGFTAEVLRDNKAMQAVFRKSPARVDGRLQGECYHFDLEFEE